MLNFGLAPKGTTPHRNNGRWKENAGGEKQLYCEPHILNSNTGWSNVQNMWHSTPPTPLCYCYNCTVLAAHFVLPHEKNDDDWSQAAETPPPKKDDDRPPKRLETSQKKGRRRQTNLSNKRLVLSIVATTMPKEAKTQISLTKFCY